MKQSKPFIALLCVLLMAAPGLYSQQINERGPDYSNQGGHWYTGFVHDYTGRHPRPIDISNSGRADSLSPAEAFALATSGGAACLGRDDLGRLEVGAAADVAVWPAADIADIDDPIDGIVLGADRRVRHLFVAGEHVVADFALTRADLAADHAELAVRSRRLWDS